MHIAEWVGVQLEGGGILTPVHIISECFEQTQMKFPTCLTTSWIIILLFPRTNAFNQCTHSSVLLVDKTFWACGFFSSGYTTFKLKKTTKKTMCPSRCLLSKKLLFTCHLFPYQFPPATSKIWYKCAVLSSLSF
jgi:hypothetical protein